MNQCLEKRSMEAGTWYWVNKVIIQEFTSVIGFHAVGVYHFLASMTDKKQCCYPSQKLISERLKCARSTVSNSIKKLETHGLIRVIRKSRYHNIYQLLDIPSSPRETQVSVRKNPDVFQEDPNNNHITRSNNNIVRVYKKDEYKRSHKTPLQPKTREELLVFDIAETLNDFEKIPLYITYVRKYPESFLREVLSETKQTPLEKIKKSRSALFSYLIKKYAQNKT